MDDLSAEVSSIFFALRLSVPLCLLCRAEEDSPEREDHVELTYVCSLSYCVRVQRERKGEREGEREREREREGEREEERKR